MLLAQRDFYRNQVKALTPDEMEALDRELSTTISGLAFLKEHIRSSKVEKGNAYNILYVAEASVGDVAKALEIELDGTEARNERFQRIRELNTKVRELQDLLGQKGTAEEVGAYLGLLDKKLNYWWDVHGFGHISELKFYGGGRAEVKFSCHLFGRTPLTGSKTPHSDRISRKEWLASLEQRGFELVGDSEREMELVDSEANRALLSNLFKSQFPSSDVTSTTNWFTRGHGPVLRDISVFFSSIAEISAIELPSE
ncbi:hypothetical protein LC612_36300 [Nostoc sp. CHAB 5834]|nr:hypothetical protein [Nostoc sp. CHAB 5834]